MTDVKGKPSPLICVKILNYICYIIHQMDSSKIIYIIILQGCFCLHQIKNRYKQCLLGALILSIDM